MPSEPMEIFESERDEGFGHPNGVVAIGNFDGVHLGHAAVFGEARSEAARLACPSVVLTFEPHPAKVLAPAFAPPLITTRARKLELIAERAIDAVFLQRFDLAFAKVSPEEFVTKILHGRLGVRHICVGHDFTFGKARAGTTESLVAFGAKLGFGVTVVPPFTVDGLVCSSTKVREFTLEGRVDGVTLLLGRDLELDGRVVRGAGRGRSIGVPTANLLLESELVPKTGVYAGWAQPLDDDSHRRYLAAINVGSNPTFGANQPTTVEAHLLEASVDLYDRPLRLGFRRRLRDEQRFPSADALVKQIHADIEATRATH